MTVWCIEEVVSRSRILEHVQRRIVYNQERDQVARLRSTLLSSGVYELLQIFAESSRTIYLSDL